MKVTAGGPLGAVVYLDEVTPGNVLRPDNRRRFWAIYLGIREFPPRALYREQFWLPLAVLRTNMAHEVRGGISYCFRALLNSVLLAPCNMAAIGVAVDLGSGPRLVRLQVKHILADEAALKAVWCSKGAAGVRPCMLCRNVVALRSNLVEGQDYLVDVACSDSSKFHESSDADIWEAWDRLAAEHGRMTKGAFASLEKASGFSYLLPPRRLAVGPWVAPPPRAGVLHDDGLAPQLLAKWDRQPRDRCFPLRVQGQVGHHLEGL